MFCLKCMFVLCFFEIWFDILIYNALPFKSNTFWCNCIYMPPSYLVVAKKEKRNNFFQSCSWSYQGLQQCFSKEFIALSCQRSVVSHHLFWPLTSVAALFGVIAALFPQSLAQRRVIFSHLAGGERTRTPFFIKPTPGNSEMMIKLG